ncbi:MAG TPA: nucleotidyltransferase family protein [Flavitalea sp.]|nr:nucleotidyltransferase family protein [Flavitalea sp.]
MILIKEAIILAGGLGTRLRSAVPDLPKCMAPVAGRPFIAYVIDYYRSQGITSFIFSLGYKHERIAEYISAAYPGLSHQCVIEEEPLGTGGAIRRSCETASGQNVMVLNGDTFFKVDIRSMSRFHQDKEADCTLALKPMINSDRYGIVETHPDHSIRSFREKQFYAKSLVNGGVYLLNTQQFLKEGLPQKFSFEKDYLEALFAERKIYGFIQDVYFIDIGIPEDFRKAQHELPANL